MKRDDPKLEINLTPVKKDNLDKELNHFECLKILNKNNERKINTYVELKLK